MIDIENIVINALDSAFTGVADVSSVFVEEPEKLPWVYVRETKNTTLKRMSDESLYEHFVTVAYRIEYYSNKTHGAKQEVKDLMQIGDIAMQSMKFTRTGSGLIPNYNRAITRGYADYTAVVREPQDVDGNTVYQMFRR